ncbi:MAG TPA: hypothetical protein VHU15_10860 [Stellaceae bacterium]|jgi:hypothetical protein|nr:hypothetical protein [Stellaceae bacterium]
MNDLSGLFMALPAIGGFVMERAEGTGHWPVRRERRRPRLWVPILILALLAIASIAAALLYPDALEPAYLCCG